MCTMQQYSYATDTHDEHVDGGSGDNNEKIMDLSTRRKKNPVI